MDPWQPPRRLGRRLLSTRIRCVVAWLACATAGGIFLVSCQPFYGSLLKDRQYDPGVPDDQHGSRGPIVAGRSVRGSYAPRRMLEHRSVRTVANDTMVRDAPYVTATGATGVADACIIVQAVLSSILL